MITRSFDVNNTGEQVYTYADGSTTTYLETNGVITEDDWTQPDGSYGREVYNADGSLVSVSNGTDGSVHTYYQEANNDRHWLYAVGAAGNSLSVADGSATFAFARGSGANQIIESVGADGADAVQYAADIADDQLWFERAGSDLVIDIIGTSDTETITDWYSGSSNQVAEFKSGDGKVLLASQVDNLVNAMAAFAPPAAGQMTLPQDYQTQLEPVIAANWQ